MEKVLLPFLIIQNPMADHQASEAQLEILPILREKEVARLLFIHKVLSQKKEVSYTTKLKQMQPGTEKGMLATVKQEGKTLLSQFKKLLFNCCAIVLVMDALRNEKPSLEEIAYLQKWLEAKKKE